MPFTNPAIQSGNVCLVSGLSFSGSSGSPVLLHQKGIPSVRDHHFVPPKIMGIMYGHWWEVSETPEMLRHSELPYFTRADSVTSLLMTMGIRLDAPAPGEQHARVLLVKTCLACS